MEIYKLLLFLSIALTCISFLYYLRKTKAVENALKDAYEALDEASVKRVRESRNNLLDNGSSTEKGMKKYIEAPYKLYVYSGFNRKFHVITFEIWSLLIVVFAAVFYFSAYFITKRAGLSVLLVVIYIALIFLLEKLAAMKNYKAVDNNLLKFLNLLENFSKTNHEITSTFHQVSRYLPDPLKTVLDECYYEAQTSGNVSLALYAMVDKIEHPKFREIISNIEICVNYSANHTETINMNRKIILEEQRARKERKSMASEFSINMVMYTVLLIAALIFVDMLIKTSVWTLVFHTTIGQICTAIIIMMFTVFWYKIATVER